MQTNSMLDYRFTKVMKALGPSDQLSQVIGDTLGHNDMTSVATIHHTLSHVDSATGNVHVRVDIGNTINGSRMHPHTQFDLCISSKSATNLNGTAHSGFRVTEENESHAVARWQTEQSLLLLGSLKLISRAHEIL